MPKPKKKKNLVQRTGRALGRGTVRTAKSIGDAIVTTAKVGKGIRKGIDTINAPIRRRVAGQIQEKVKQTKKDAKAASGRLSEAAKKKLREKTSGLRKIKLTQTIRN